MKTITIHSKKYGTKSVLVDDADFDALSAYRWCAQPSDYNLYARGKVGGKMVYMSRLITGCPKHLEVDHIDGNTLNNQRSNLRLVSRYENLKNRRPFKSNKLGERLICRTILNGRHEGYRVYWTPSAGTQKNMVFRTLSAAKSFRDQILKEHYTVQP